MPKTINKVVGGLAAAAAIVEKMSGAPGYSINRSAIFLI